MTTEKNKELTYASTVDDMLSNDWKRRLKAEYDQLSVRLARLNHTIEFADENQMEGTLYAQIGVLKIQALVMSTYKRILEERAKLVGFTL